MKKQVEGLEALDPARITTYSPDKQPDIQQMRVYDKPMVSGVPATDSIIFSSFDARPIAGGDFYFTSGGPAVGEPSGAFVNFSVPNGYRAILRGFKYTLDPLVGINLISDITGLVTTGGAAFEAAVKPKIGGTIVQGYSSLFLGPTPDMTPCYVIGDSGQFISVIINFSTAYAAAIAVVLLNTGIPFLTVNFVMYGNLLVSSGRALNFEPGTNPEQLGLKPTNKDK